ncbi:MAG: hypothetical protein QXO57_02525 [Candidatus Aenigmatarchaeota archaeon]
MSKTTSFMLQKIRILSSNEETRISSSDQLTYEYVFGVLKQIKTLTDFRILKKIYNTGKNYPFDTTPYSVPTLYDSFKREKISISVEAIRKALKRLEKFKLIVKGNSNSYPVFYYPIANGEKIIKEVLELLF